MDTREMITLQIGHYANYVGAHYWNIQESLVYNQSPKEFNHDILFREGLTPISRQPTYLPRLVIVDLKGSLGHLPELGDLYDNLQFSELDKSQIATQQSIWHGNVAVSKDESRGKNRFLKSLERGDNFVSDLDKDVCEDAAGAEESNDIDDEDIKVWSDYLRMRYHPKTNVILKEYQHENSAGPFDVYGLGVEEAKSINDECEDRIRFFAEECDFLQGFQIVLDSEDSFAGYASETVRFLADEFSSKCILAFPVMRANPGSDPQQSVARFLNSSLALRSLCVDAGLVTPLSMGCDTFPLRGSFRNLKGLTVNPESLYQSSAVLASTLENLSSPWRLKNARHNMGDLTSGLGSYGKRLASVATVMPFPQIEKNGYDCLADMLFEPPSPENPFELQSLTPSVEYSRDELWMEAFSLRGLEGFLKPPGYCISEAHFQKKYNANSYYRCDSLSHAMLAFYNKHSPQTKVGVTSVEALQPVAPPYPKIFEQDHLKIASTVATSWQSARSTGSLVGKTTERLARINLRKFHRFVEAGLEQDDLAEVIEDLKSLENCYNPDKFQG